jgi:hypothetical protein
MPVAPQIFWDPDISPGDQWPAALRDALARSRILVPVFTNPYFRSSYCLAELNTMIARENALALRARGSSQGIIYPVRFYGDDYPETIREIQWVDMSDWAYPDVSFRETVQYIGFVDAVRAFATKLAHCLPLAPEWAPDWPERLPEPTPLTEIPLPRL